MLKLASAPPAVYKKVAGSGTRKKMKRIGKISNTNVRGLESISTIPMMKNGREAI